MNSKKGMQAALASDYAIGEFRIIKRLFLVHGRWNYNRLSLLILLLFFKNVAYGLVQLWYGFFNGFSGQTSYESVSSLGYNLIFTALPPLILAIFDRDLPPYVLMKYPKLYRQTQRNLYVGGKKNVR